MYYNTGKVMFGSSYDLIPLIKKYVEQDQDMLLLQQYLICDVALLRRRYIARRICELIGAFILLVILLKGTVWKST
jgi:hypothetical protein